MTANRETVENWYRALRSGDIELFTNVHAEDVVYDVSGHSPISGRHIGRAKLIGELSAAVFSAIDVERFVFCTRYRIVAEDGDCLVGVMEADGPTVTGDRYDQRYVHIFELNAGLIVRVIEFFDTALARDTLFKTCPPVPADGDFQL